MKTITTLLLKLLALSTLIFVFAGESFAQVVVSPVCTTYQNPGGGIQNTCPNQYQYGNPAVPQYSTYAPGNSSPGRYPQLCAVLTRTFGIGDSGEDVKQLQIALGQEGVAYLGATGYFGAKTKAAVKIWQTRNGFRSPTGAVGPLTLSAMKNAWCSGGNVGIPNPPTNPGYGSAANVTLVPVNSSGYNVTLQWTSTNVNSCTLNGQTVPPSGTQSVYVSTQTDFTITCNGYNGSISKTITVRPNADYTNLPTVNAYINPTSALINTSATIYWTSTNAISCTLNGQTVPPNGSQQIYVTQNNQSYRITCNNQNGLSASATIYSSGTQSPGTIATLNFAASNYNITTPNGSTITWSTTNTQSCTVTGGGQSYSGTNGSQVVYPTSSTNYVLTCIDTNGQQATNTLTINVNGSSGNLSLVVQSGMSVTVSIPSSGGTITWGDGQASYPGSISCVTAPCTQNVNHAYSSNGTYTITFNYNGTNQTISVIIGGSSGNVPFAANPTSVTTGQSSTLTWNSNQGNYCTIAGGNVNLTNLPISGTQIVYPTATSSYVLNCFTTGNSTAVASSTVTVNYNNGTSGNITANISLSPSNISSGQAVSISWSSTNANYCNLYYNSNILLSNQPTSGSNVQYPTTGGNYYVACFNGSGQSANSQTLYLTVNGSSGGNITVNVSANPPSVSSGQPSTITWNSTNASYCTITGNGIVVGSTNQSSSGSYVVYPSQGTNYIVTCYNYTGANGAGFVYITTNGYGGGNVSATLYSSAQNVNAGQAVTLNWYSSNANYCNLYTNNNITQSGQNSSGSYLVYPNASTNYSVTCFNTSTGQTGQSSVYVTVNGGGSVNGYFSVISNYNRQVNIQLSGNSCAAGYVNWGDGQTSNFGSGCGQTLQHYYNGPGNFTITEVLNGSYVANQSIYVQ